MNKEESLIESLTQKFPSLNEKCEIIRPRRVTIVIDKDKVLEVFKCLCDEHKYDFVSTISGLDSGDNFEIIYHLNDKEGVLINAKVFTPKTDPVIKSTIEVYPGAIFYERELEDMFGIKVEGLPPGRNYPLPENWPKGEHPLRKDWSPNKDESIENSKEKEA